MGVESLIDLVDPNLHWPLRLRINPFYALYSGSFPGDYTALPSGYVLFCKLWFVLSCIFLALLSRQSRPALAAVAAASVMLSFAIGPDAVWSMMHCFPTVLLLLQFAKDKSAAVQTVLGVAGALLWGATAGPFGFAGSIFLLIWFSELTPVAFAASFFAALIASISLLPVYEMPAYPDNARLAPVSPATFWGSPLAGPEIFPSPLNYDGYLSALKEVQQTSGIVALVTLVLVALLALKRGGRPNLAEQAVIGFTVLLPIWIWTERHTGFSLTFLVSKLLFGLALAPLPLWIFSGLLIGFVATLPARSGTSPGAGFALTVGIALSALVPVYGSGSAPVLQGGPHGKFFSDSVMDFFVQGGARVPPDELRTFSHLTGSTTEASLHSGLSAKAVDGNKRTRWSTGTLQKGGEEFQIHFAAPRRCPTLRLRLGRWLTDFPRGLAVDAKTPSSPETYKPLVNFSTWQGPLRVTKEGMYYFGPQNVIEVSLPEQGEISSLRLRQTSHDSFYFWSIAEAECLNPAAENLPAISSK